MKIIFKTKSFALDETISEIDKLINIKPKMYGKDLVFIEIPDDEDRIKLLYRILYYSRFVEDFYLHIDTFNQIDDKDTITNKLLTQNKFDLDFAIEFKSTPEHDKSSVESHFGNLIRKSNKNFEVNLSNPELVFEVIINNSNFELLLKLNLRPLFKREYKVNTNSNSINPIVVNYLISKLDIDTSLDVSVVDPVANLGDIIIEVASTINNVGYNSKERFLGPISKFFGIDGPSFENPVLKNRFVGIVQNNKVFKELKENLNFSNVKVRPSQFDLDWLDVKFEKNEFDYAITCLQSFRDSVEYEEFLDQLFYQLEHIIKKKIGIIARSPVKSSIIKKNKLKLILEETVNIGDQGYYLYIIS